MYGLRVLRAHEMPMECLHEVFRSAILARLTSVCKSRLSSLVGLLLNRRYKEARQPYQQKQANQLPIEVYTGPATLCRGWYFIFKSVLTNRNHVLNPLSSDADIVRLTNARIIIIIIIIIIIYVCMYVCTWDVGYPYLCANYSLPRPLCSRLRSNLCDRQTSDRHTSDPHHRLMPPTLGAGHNN